jgi:hypothetical protein
MSVGRDDVGTVEDFQASATKITGLTDFGLSADVVDERCAGYLHTHA